MGGTRTRSPGWSRYSALHPAFVHPNFAAAQDAIDVALGHALGDAQQEVVDALSVGLVANLKPCNRIFA
jgi:hypothetical protein